MKYRSDLLPRLEEIIIDYYDMEEGGLRKRTRREETVIPRQVFQYLAFELRLAWKRKIAMFLGYNHATILYNINIIKDEISVNRRLRQDVNEIAEILNKEIEDEDKPLFPSLESLGFNNF